MTTWSAGLRWSYSSRAWMGFLASQADGTLLCRHELSWRQTSPEDAAKQIRAKMSDWQIDRLASFIANAEIFPKANERGRTESEAFQRAGLPIQKGSEDRVNVWACLRSWLSPHDRKNGTRGPMLFIHPDCKILLRTLPTLVSSPTEPDDVVRSPDEYASHALALCLMARPSPSTIEEDPLPVGAIGHWVHEIRNSL